MKRADLSFSDVDRLVAYDPETGIITHKVARGGIRPGDVAGHLMDLGYILVGLGGVQVMGHQIAWILMTGAWPSDTVDHEDLDRANNRWGNLREATKGEQMFNLPTRKNSKSGVKGVTWIASRGKWRAGVTARGRSYHLGYFDNKEDAAAARRAGAERLHGKFARHA